MTFHFLSLSPLSFLFLFFAHSIHSDSSQIKFSLLPQLFILNDTSQVFFIHTNYLNIYFNISSLINIKFLLISNDFYDDFNSSILCSNSSKFCYHKVIDSSFDNSDITFNFSLCEPTLYFLMIKDDINQNSSFIIESQFIDGDNCRYLDLGLLAYCSHFDISQCKSCSIKKCTTIQCGNIKKDNDFVSTLS